MDEKTADTDHFHCCTGRIAGFFCCAESAAEEPADGEPAEWTVMFYLCGANLESKYGFATNTLEEIQLVSYPYNMIPIYTAETVSISDMMRDVGKVNILVETGGAKKWILRSRIWRFP